MSKGNVKPPLKLTPAWQTSLDDHVISLAWSPDGKRLACAAVGGPIKVCDGQSGEVRHDLSGHGFGTTCVAWSGDGAHLASAGQDGKVKLWDLDQNRERLALPGGAAWVDRLTWCPVVNVLASAAGKKLRLWDPAGKMLREYPDHPSTIADIAWQPRAEILASAAYGQLALWRTNANEPYRCFEWKGSMLALSWSPNGQYLATGDQDSTVHFWIVKTGEDLMMSGYPAKVKELSWDSSSRYLATGGGTMPCIWDCSGSGPAGTRPQQFEAHTQRITALAFQNRTTLLASGGADNLIALWGVGRTKEPLVQEYLPAAITQLAWSPDDRYLAAGTENGVLVVYTLS
jgi:WD40 repeat protein